MLKKLEEEKKEEQEQLDICGEDFLFAVSKMIQDLDGGDFGKFDNFGNTTTKKKMLETGNSSQFSILLNKNIDTDIPQQAIEGY